MKYTNPCFSPSSCNVAALILTAAWLLMGCGSSTSAEEEPKPQITDALIELDGAGDQANLEVGETAAFDGFALTESGGAIPLAELGENWSWQWESTDTSVFTVDDEGYAIGRNEGEAYCVITLNGPDDSAAGSIHKQGTTSITGSYPGFPEMSGIFVGRDSLFVIFLN